MDSTLGYVYCVRCDDHSVNMYKVGSGKCIDSRLKSLNTAGVPSEFKLQFAKKLADYKLYINSYQPIVLNQKKNFLLLNLLKLKRRLIQWAEIGMAKRIMLQTE